MKRTRETLLSDIEEDTARAALFKQRIDDARAQLKEIELNEMDEQQEKVVRAYLARHTDLVLMKRPNDQLCKCPLFQLDCRKCTRQHCLQCKTSIGPDPTSPYCSKACDDRHFNNAY